MEEPTPSTVSMPNPTYGDPIEHSKRVHRNAMFIVAGMCGTFALILVITRGMHVRYPKITFYVCILGAIQLLLGVVIYQSMGRALESLSYRCAMKLVESTTGFQRTFNTIGNELSNATKSAEIAQARRDAQLRTLGRV